MSKPPNYPKRHPPAAAVIAMAPYSPPTGGPRRQTAARFQREHRRLLAARDRSDPAGRRTPKASPSIRNTATPKPPSREYFHVAPEQFVFTNGTDEAIQVFINTYVDDGQEVVMLKPAYAMYRFYAEVAGAKVRRGSPTRSPTWNFRWTTCCNAITPETRAVLIANPNNPTGTAAVAARESRGFCAGRARRWC